MTAVDMEKNTAPPRTGRVPEFGSVKEALLYIHSQQEHLNRYFMVVRHLNRDTYQVYPFSQTLAGGKHNHQIVGYFKALIPILS